MLVTRKEHNLFWTPASFVAMKKRITHQRTHSWTIHQFPCSEQVLPSAESRPCALVHLEDPCLTKTLGPTKECERSVFSLQKESSKIGATWRIRVKHREHEQPADVLRGNESVFSDANPANVAKSLLEGNGDHLPTQARSELMKQEHKGGISQ